MILLVFLVFRENLLSIHLSRQSPIAWNRVKICGKISIASCEAKMGSPICMYH